MTHVPSIVLNNGHLMPMLGYGVWRISDDEAAAAVGHAFTAGYRSIDTAAIYRNERGVGQAIARSGLPRNELFITTKIWNDMQGYDNTLKGFDQSMEKLGLDHVDLYLIHWPVPSKGLFVETWKALEKLHADGRAKSIGVSNFRPVDLTRLIEQNGIVPAVNQVELHPFFQQTELRAFHAAHGIATEAWSPLAQGAVDEPEIVAIARKLNRSPAQVILRWHLQLGNVAIPKSATPSRIRENFAILDFELDEQDMARMAALDSGNRIGPNPDSFTG